MKSQNNLDKWSNASRKSKRSFQAMLKPEEAELVDRAKELTGEGTDRGVLLALCKRLLERADKEQSA